MGGAITYTPQQLVDVARRHGVDLAHLVPQKLNGRERSQPRYPLEWIEQIQAAGRQRRKVDGDPDHVVHSINPAHLACSWVLAADVRAAAELWSWLVERGLQLAERERWRPMLYKGGSDDRIFFIVEEVARVVVAEHGPSAVPLFAAAPMLPCWLLGIDACVWNQHLSRPHTALSACFERWLNFGLNQLREWIVADSALTSS